MRTLAPLVLLFAAAAAEPLKANSPAPALTFTQLLQAPPAARADLPSLRGKVVVLEFWATWCGPCVAQIPSLNALQAASKDPRIQFISVDDEDPTKIAAFLKRKSISGWLAFDTTGKTITRYNADSRPITIVIDPTGHIVSNSSLNDVRPEDIQPGQLLALAQGKPVTFTKIRKPGAPAPKSLIIPN